MPKELEVTVGITCFNGEKTIGKAINSALIQNYAPREIIVVDDASSDRSGHIIQELIKIHPLKIRLIRHSQNLGCPASRNTVLQHAKGDYIAFFDDDDISSDDRLKQQVQVIQKIPQWRKYPVACYASGVKIYQNGYKKRFYAPGALGPSPSAVELKRYLLMGEKKGE
ncbi:MAG: glycosyltransferase family 2 protein, partial [Halobacteriovoraceae bacterium]|nr:glycosyltransferase family 2 protein [Halobacteriovoraceae bacterium]